MKRILLLAWVLTCSVIAFPVGEWTDYSSYSSAQQVVVASNKVYCVTTGGLFTVDTTDNSLQKLTGINGLSDVGVNRVGYGDEAEVVLVAYKNSNLDLIIGREIFNLSDIKRKLLPADKTIYNILFVGQTAYLSCGFGIVAVNLEKREIKDTYYIGENGAAMKVTDMAFDGQFLYAATEKGIFKAPVSAANLQDFRFWERDESIPNADGPFDQLEYFAGSLIAGFDGGDVGRDELYRFTNGVWNSYLPGLERITDVQASSGFLTISTGEKVAVYRDDGTLADQVDSYPLASFTVNSIHANSAVVDGQGDLWMADQHYALIRKTGGNFSWIVPHGPADNHVFALSVNGADLWLASGGRNLVWNNLFYGAQFQLYRNGNWQAFNNQTDPAWGHFHDVVCVAANPASPDQVFSGSWGGGVAEFRDGKFVARYHNFNSTLQTALPNQPNEPYVRISDLDFDSDGNLWVVNSAVEKPLSVLKSNGEWESFALPGIQSNKNVGQLVMTPTDDQWIVIPQGEGLAVRKADGSDFRRLSVVAYFNNGSEEVFTSMNDIYAAAVDRDGAVWLGTSAGVAVYSQPGEIWEQSTYYASQPGLDLGDGLYHPLLSTQTVTAIAVDGANRKWVGTKNSGLYLVSEDGQQEISHFNTGNSPLLADEITSLAINDQTGEVFIGTVEGLISYMGEATAGSSGYDAVFAYPNPVREDYDGDVVITGLMEDTQVKITDISGNLVYQTTSLGGQAAWDGKNFRGNRVSTGVYLVFGNDRYGEQTFVTKILFIH
ncbi:hypothetical protein [Gaoshiqia sediminis]|uniref:PorZ N-terminal beta-propeller domain-containing protein n=1 Tax=Gaoshiqia sediminis TaxID=2986998 RepID=A0AA41YF15_9BACT|nr:hypothetical protein [Gaoshiqia sediminis]MCW0484872.1 hypothetical protein [Gaoshiqia sediminis]